jgi:hypothetical protein
MKFSRIQDENIPDPQHCLRPATTAFNGIPKTINVHLPPLLAGTPSEADVGGSAGGGGRGSALIQPEVGGSAGGGRGSVLIQPDVGGSAGGGGRGSVHFQPLHDRAHALEL